jgi:hypothetical protein
VSNFEKKGKGAEVHRVHSTSNIMFWKLLTRHSFLAASAIEVRLKAPFREDQSRNLPMEGAMTPLSMLATNESTGLWVAVWWDLRKCKSNLERLLNLGG